MRFGLFGSASARRGGAEFDSSEGFRDFIGRGNVLDLAVGVIICKSIANGRPSAVLRRTPSAYFGSVRVPIF